MKEDVFTDEQLWDEVLEVLNDNRRELTDEEVASLLQERKVFPLRYVVLPAVAAALAIGFFLWPKAGPSLSPPMGGRTPGPSLTPSVGGRTPLSYGDLLSRNEALPPTGGAGRGAATPSSGNEALPPTGGTGRVAAPLSSGNEALPPTGGAGRGATADEQPQVELLNIDMEAVHQQGEDLRMAMAAMNNELFEME
jgi:hypothetical protein